jgi:hypothetical protein
MVKPHQFNWLTDDIPVKTPFAVAPGKPLSEPRFVPISSQSRETMSEYRKKLFARLRTARDPKEIETLMSQI